MADAAFQLIAKVEGQFAADKVVKFDAYFALIASFLDFPAQLKITADEVGGYAQSLVSGLCYREAADKPIKSPSESTEGLVDVLQLLYKF